MPTGLTDRTFQLGRVFSHRGGHNRPCFLGGAVRIAQCFKLARRTIRALAMAPGVGRAQSEGDQGDHSECPPATVFVHCQIVRVSLSLFGAMVAEATGGGLEVSFATGNIGCRFLRSGLQVSQVRGAVTAAE